MYMYSQLQNSYMRQSAETMNTINSSLRNTVFYNPVSNALFKSIKAFTPTLEKPQWDIANYKPVSVGTFPAVELVKFVGERSDPSKPNILVVAPVSGHYATLLSDTVERLTADYTVYVTDWVNVRDNPSIAGYGLADYVNVLSALFNLIPGGTHVLSVCQGCVPSLMALCSMRHSNVNSITLMAGPVDTRVGRTSINKFCDEKTLDWFKANVIQSVSHGFAANGKKVYPGNLQLMGFMSMNPKSHQQKFADHFRAELTGNETQLKKITEFYAEYMAVMDIPAPFYLEMINDIFLDQKLVKGEATLNGKSLSLKDIKCPVLVIEGENDDICGIGQTLAVFNSLPSSVLTSYHQQDGVGHYGCFSGNKWREEIAPAIVRFHRIFSVGFNAKEAA